MKWLALGLQGIGLAVVSIIVLATASIAWRGLRLSISFHRTAFEGMRKSGRKVKWRHVPWSVLKEAYDLGLMGYSREVTGAGFYWSSDGESNTWDDRIAQPGPKND